MSQPNMKKFKELNLCFLKLVNGELCTLFWGSFPDRGSNPVPDSKVPGSNPNQENLPKIKCAVRH